MRGQQGGDLREIKRPDVLKDHVRVRAAYRVKGEGDVVFGVDPSRGQHGWDDEHTRGTLPDHFVDRLPNGGTAELIIADREELGAHHRAQRRGQLFQAGLVRIVPGMPGPPPDFGVELCRPPSRCALRSGGRCEALAKQGGPPCTALALYRAGTGLVQGPPRKMRCL